MRLLYCLQDPSQELRFGFNVAKEPRNHINILYNMSKLIENVKPGKIFKIEDKWILSKFNSLIKKVTAELENLHPHLASRALQEFWLKDLSRGYIQLVRDRLSMGDETAKGVLNHVYVGLIKLCAPFIPFITEKIWQELKQKNLVKEESIHLCSWQKHEGKKTNEKLEEDFEDAFFIIERGLAVRDKEKIGLKWPLSKAIVKYEKDLGKEILEIIARQLNVKKVELKKADQINVKLDSKLTKDLEAEGYAREMSRQIQAFRKKLGLDKKDMVKTTLIVDSSFKKTIERQKDLLKNRTNSKKLEIVTTSKERFKNKTGFKIKDKKGEIAIITTSK